jgi:hypothetical protein
MKNQRLCLILIGLLLLLTIYLVWPETKSADSPNEATNTESNRKRIGWHLLGIGQNEKQQRPLNRTQSSGNSAMERIDRLITHQALGNHEVAEQLLIIAKDKRIPENARAEALGHGVILDLPVFAHMAVDSQLPEEMAEDLLQHVINDNGNQALQIRAYVDFLNHSSPEIREEAKQMLAFILEDDLGEADEATLIQMADAKLKQLEAEKSQGDK